MMWDRGRLALIAGVTLVVALLSGFLAPGAAALPASPSAPPGRPVGLSEQYLSSEASFAGLGNFKPLQEQVFGEGTLSVNPRRRGVVAWCGTGYMGLQDGRTVVHVPTAGALRRIAAWLAGRAGHGYGTSCHQVALGSQPGQIFASFVLWPDCQGSRTPRVINGSFGLYTDDDGKTWTFVPVPHGRSEPSFQGFSYGPAGQVQASFSPKPGSAYELTTDGGRRWSLVPATATPCSLRRLCAYFNAAPPSVVCIGFSGPWASLEVSLDGGTMWTTPFQVVGYQSFATLVALGGQAALLVSNGGGSAVEPVAGTTAPKSPVMFSSDRGRSWHAIAVPPISGRQPSQFGPIIVVLPDGDLLYVGASLVHGSPGWQLLRKGAKEWCTVKEPPGSAISASWATVTVTGGEVWWMVGGKAEVANPRSITC